MQENMEFELEKFSNEDLYCIISDLLRLGGLGDQIIEREKLFVSFDSSYGEVSEIHFFFLSKLPILSDDQAEPQTGVSLGKFNCDMDNIEFRTFSVPCSIIDPDIEPFNIELIKGLLQSPQICRMNPIRIVRGLEQLTAKNFTSKKNDLFKLFWNSPIDQKFIRTFDFGIVDDTKYEGTFYLVVEPTPDNDQFASIVNHFEVIDNAEQDETNAEYKQHAVICTPIQFSNSLIDL